MEELRMAPPDEISNPKSRKKKATTQVVSTGKAKGELKGGKDASQLPPKGQKASKRNLKNDAPLLFQQTDRSTPDSLPDSSGPSDEYRALRRRYLLLEEESFSFGRELNEVEAEVKALEDEKFALLDQLVVLEGLVDPSEVKPH